MKLNYKVQEVLLIDKTLHVPGLYSENQLKLEARRQKKEYRSALWGKLHREWKTSLKQNKLLELKQDQDRVTIENLKNEIEKLKFEMFYEKLSESSDKVAENSGKVAEFSKLAKINGQSSKPANINAATSKTAKINPLHSKSSKLNAQTLKASKTNVLSSKTATLNVLASKTAKRNAKTSKLLKIKLKSLSSIQNHPSQANEEHTSKLKWYRVAPASKSMNKKPQPIWRTYDSKTESKPRPEPLYVQPPPPKKSSARIPKKVKPEPKESSDSVENLANNPETEFQQNSPSQQQQISIQENILLQQQIPLQQNQLNSPQQQNSSALSLDQMQQISLAQRQQEYRNRLMSSQNLQHQELMTQQLQAQNLQYQELLAHQIQPQEIMSLHQ